MRVSQEEIVSVDREVNFTFQELEVRIWTKNVETKLSKRSFQESQEFTFCIAVIL